MRWGNPSMLSGWGRGRSIVYWSERLQGQTGIISGCSRMKQLSQDSAGEVRKNAIRGRYNFGFWIGAVHIWNRPLYKYIYIYSSDSNCKLYKYIPIISKDYRNGSTDQVLR